MSYFVNNGNINNISGNGSCINTITTSNHSIYSTTDANGTRTVTIHHPNNKEWWGTRIVNTFIQQFTSSTPRSRASSTSSEYSESSDCTLSSEASTASIIDE